MSYSKQELTNQIKNLQDALDLSEKQSKHFLNNSLLVGRKDKRSNLHNLNYSTDSPIKGNLNYTYTNLRSNINDQDSDNITVLKNLKYTLSNLDKKLSNSKERNKK